MDQGLSSFRLPWWKAYTSRGVNGDALRRHIGAVSQHFSAYNLALLIVEYLLQTGLLFYTTSSMGGFVEVPNNMVVDTVKVALETQYDNTVIQQFRDQFNRMENTQLASVHVGAPHHQRHASLMPYLVEMNLANEQGGVVRQPALVDPSRRQVLLPPPNAVIFAHGYDNLATTIILRHVLGEVRTSYSRPTLARQIWGMVFGDDTAGSHRDQGVFFIERALEMGYDKAWGRVYVTNPMTGATDAAAPDDDDGSIGSISFDETEKADPIELDEDLARTFSSDDDGSYEE